MKWYTYLKNNEDDTKKDKALLECETLEDFNLVVSHKLKYMTFGRFNNYLDFAKYFVTQVPNEKKCFYEIIFGNKIQKIYFDIEFYTSPNDDIYVPEDEADKSVSFLVECINDEISEILNVKNPLSLNDSHIFVFTSHKENKKSYHVVVEGFSVTNFKENKEFHDRVIRRVPDKWKNIVDHGMYKSVQQFRIVGNTKFESNRYKILNNLMTKNQYGFGWNPKITPESENHRLILLLESSLISQNMSTIILPSLVKEESVKKYQTFNEGTDSFVSLTSDEIRKALELCYIYAGLKFGDPRFPYSYLQTKEETGTSSLILLKRHRPSTCAICNRIHENENPYLIIFGENRDVYLDCRRNTEGKKLHVGQLGPREKKETETVTETNVPEIKVSPPKNEFNVKDFIRSSNIYTKKPPTPMKQTSTIKFKLY